MKMKFLKRKKLFPLLGVLLAALMIIPIGTALALDGADGLYIDGKHVADGETYTLTVAPDAEADTGKKMEYWVDGEAKLWNTDYRLVITKPAAGDTLTGNSPTISTSATADKLSLSIRMLGLSERHAGQDFTYTLTLRDIKNANAVVATVYLKLTVTGEQPQQHSVTIDPKYNAADPAYDASVAHGRISLTGTYDAVWPGETVKYNIQPDSGYQLVPGSAMAGDQTLVSGLSKTFTMPNEDVVLTAQFAQNIAISYDLGDYLGDTLNSTHVALPGQKASIEIISDKGYGILADSVEVRDAAGKPLEVGLQCTGMTYGSGSNSNRVTCKYTFIMPDEPVTFYAREQTAFSISADPALEHATVSFEKSTGLAFEETVTFTVTPDPGWQLAPDTQPVLYYTNGDKLAVDRLLSWENGTGTLKMTSMDLVLGLSAAPVEVQDGLYLNGQYVEKNGTYTINVDPGSVAKIDVSYILNGANAVFGDRDVDGSYCGLSFGPMRDEDGTQRVAGITSNYAYEGAVQSRQFEVSFIGKDAGKTYNLRVRVSNKDETINTLFYVRFVVSENPTGVTSTVNLDNFQGMDHAQISIFGATGISTEELLAGAEAWPGSIVTVEYTPEEGYWRDPQALKIVDRDGQPVEIINVNLNKEYRLNLQFRMPYGGAFIYENVQPNGEFTFLPMEHGSITLNSATAGSVASLTITPEEGYILDTLTARNSQGEVVKDYVYASDIVMSNGLVGSSVPFDGRNMTVEATFKKKVLQFNIVDTQNGSVTVDAEWYDKGVNDYAGVAVQGAPFGETVTFTVTPDAGYALDDLIVRNNKGQSIAYTSVGNNMYQLEVPKPELGIYQININAKFAPADYDITWNAVTGGQIQSDIRQAPMGQAVTFTVTPDTGYMLTPGSVQVNGGAVALTENGNGTYTFTMPGEAVVISAAFEKINYAVTLGTFENGAVTASAATAQMGDTVTLTVSPDTGYQLVADSLKVNGGDVALTDNGDGTYTFTMPAAAVTVEAAFEKADYAVTLGTVENGTVTASAATAQMGDTVTLTVSPDTGYQLVADSLKVNGGDVALTDNGDGTYTFTMPAAAVTVEAAFEKIGYTVTVGTFENGTVTASAATVPMGDTVTLTVTPDTGYRLVADSLKVNGGDVALTDNGDGTYTFTMPVGAVEITAEFEQLPEDPTEPEEPPTDPEEPPTDPEDPPTDPEDPPTDPEEPSTDPEEPSTDPEEPSTEPEEPSEDPEEPSSDAPATDGADGDEPTSSSGQDNVDTGDAALAAAAGAALLSAGAVLVLTKKKRRS